MNLTFDEGNLAILAELKLNDAGLFELPSTPSGKISRKEHHVHSFA